jgi:hypothetical protein
MVELLPHDWEALNSNLARIGHFQPKTLKEEVIAPLQELSI